MALEETLRANFAYTLKSLLCLPDVSHGNGKKGFGENALNVRGKIFAMLTPTQGFVVKLHKDRAQEMFESGLGAPFQMAGRQMKEWVVVKSDDKVDWKNLAHEAYAFVGGNA